MNKKSIKTKLLPSEQDIVNDFTEDEVSELQLALNAYDDNSEAHEIADDDDFSDYLYK